VIEVKNLSSGIDLDSFRVSGLGTARLLVTTCSVDRHPDIKTSDPIHALQAQVVELTDEKGSLEAEIAILRDYGKNMANMPDLTPDSASSFSDKLFEKTRSKATAVRGLDTEIMELRRQIDKLKDAKTGMTNVRAIVTIVADKVGPAQLRLTYRESSAQMFSEIPC